MFTQTRQQAKIQHPIANTDVEAVGQLGLERAVLVVLGVDAVLDNLLAVGQARRVAAVGLVRLHRQAVRVQDLVEEGEAGAGEDADLALDAVVALGPGATRGQQDEQERNGDGPHRGCLFSSQMASCKSRHAIGWTRVLIDAPLDGRATARCGSGLGVRRGVC